MKLCLRLSIFVLVVFLGPLVVSAQSDSRRASLDEAERLCLASGKIEADAEGEFRSNLDRNALSKAHLKAIENVEKAIEIWMSLNEEEFVDRGLTELARLYLTAHDVDSAIAVSDRLCAYWRGRGNIDREGAALFVRSVRLSQGHRFEDALRSLPAVEAFAIDNHLTLLRVNCADERALLLKLLGRETESEAATKEARKIRRQLDNSPVVPSREAQPAARLPVGWIDVPDAPVVAEIRAVDGKDFAILVNRTNKPIVGVTMGCISKSDSGLVIKSGLFGIGISDADVGPGAYFDVTRSFGSPRNEWTDRPMGCDDALVGVTGVRFADGSEWRLKESDSQ